MAETQWGIIKNEDKDLTWRPIMPQVKGQQATAHGPNPARGFFVSKGLLEYSCTHLFTYDLWVLSENHGRVE